MAVQESRLIISIDARNAERTARELSRELQNITDGGNRATQQTGALSTSLRSLAGYMAGIVTVGSAINKMDTWTGLQNRLKLVTNNQQELSGAMRDTFKIAQETAQAWSSVAQVYQRFADNSKTLGITLEQTASLTTTVSKAIAVSGASAAAAEAALMQFGQALASGVLRGEEFNSIAEQAPALLKAIANGLGVGIGQLRAMAAEGQLTGDVVIKSLEKAKTSVDELFGKTDFTIANSFTQLNNAVIQFIGEAGKANGSASLLSETIKLLAENLNLIANVAVVGGVALLTKTILSQTVAMQGAIASSIQRRATLLSELQAQTAITAMEVQRTRQVAALALTEINLSRAEYNNATTRAARAAATVKLTQAEIAYRIALTQNAAALAADTVAQNANNAARSRGAILLGALGGPIGAITIGVTALAAGYMYMSAKAKEANLKLEEQGKVAEKTNEELLKLAGNDKKNAVSDLTAAFKSQNAELAKSKEAVDAVLFAIRASSVENEKARKVTEDARNGVISYNKAVELLNKMDISTELYDQLKKTANQYDENSLKAGNSQKKLSILGFEFTLTGNKAQDSENKIKGNTDALDDNARAAIAATKAHQDYLSKAQAQAFDDIYSTGLMAQGRTPAQAKAILDLQKAKGESAILTKEEIDQALRNLALTQQNTAAEKSYADGINKRAKAQSDAAKKAEQARKEAAREAERLAKEQYDLRESIAYEFADRTMQIEKDLQSKIADIQKANFSPQDTAGYIANAKARAESEKEIFISQLEYQLNEFNLTEEAKLKKKYEINKLMIESDLDLSNENRDIALRLTEQKYKLEKAFLEISRQQRAFQAREQFMDETTRINEKYRLEEAAILKNNDAKERAFELDMSRLKKQAEEQSRLDKARLAVSNSQAQASGIGGFVSIEVDRNEQVAASEELYQAELARNFEAREALYAAHNERVDAINQEANAARLSLQLNYGEQITGSIADMFKQQGEDQSTAYKVMFAASKAFAIAQSLISIQQGIAQAAANPWPLNLAAMASVAASTASLVGNIKAVADVGFMSGGYTGSGGVSDVAGVVHGQEYVLNAAATKRVGTGTLDAINSGGSLGGEISVNIQNFGTSKEFEVQQIDENTVRIIARDETEKTVARQLASPNSPISKGIKNNFNTSNRRG